MRLVLATVALSAAHPASAAVVRVTDAAQLALAAQRAMPGDMIVVANGVWTDQPVAIVARGAAGRPVTIVAETPGGVVLSGRTGLTIGGSDVVVSGFVFRDARSAGAALVAIDDAARGIVLAEVVVDRATRSDRRDTDVWVRVGGTGNAVERSRFIGKGNAGPTLLVTGSEARIVGNHFARRPMLGLTGGETIRVAPGARGALIDANLIEDCDGGTATVAVEGDGAAVRGNLILRSRGSIVVTGGGARIERNVVRGYGERDSGGVVIAGADAVVRDNYLERLATPAIALIGPGGGEIAQNSAIDSARILIASSGSARFERNLIRTTLDPFRFTAGARVSYAGNRSSFDPPASVGGGVVRDARDFVATPAGFLRLPDGGAGAAVDLVPLDRTTAGPRWHRLPPRPPSLGSGRVIEVADDLAAAVRGAAAGETLHLADRRHRLHAPIVIDRPLTITGPARIEIASATAFQIVAGGSLRLDGVTLSGAAAPQRVGNAIVRAPLVDGAWNYSVLLDDVTVTGLKAPGYDVVATTPGSFADRIDIRGSRFTDVSGAIVASAGVTPGYRVALVRIDGSRIVRVGRIADIARMGDDGFGPVAEITDNSVERSGALRLNGVASAIVAGNVFATPAPVVVTGHDAGAAVTVRCNQGAGAVTIKPPVTPQRVSPDWRAAVPCDWPR